MQKKRVKVHRKSTRWITAIVVAALAMAAVLVMTSLTSARSSAITVTSPSSALSECGGPMCGQANAPVTIEIYSDFQ
jgi:hypothetical protein